MSPAWHRLTLQQSNLPPLLFQFTWTHKGYNLYITDLTSIWSEELSHHQILKQAEENATTIDPSEDKDQFEVLLVKIGEALRGDGGSATLNSSQSNELQLTTSSKLPPPLRPLKWIMHLSKQASPSITDQLLLPLLRNEAGWEFRQRLLLDQLKQKDWVIGKMFDKFEVLGVDPGTAFPAAAGVRSKKGNTRPDVGRVIKGVAIFDETKWLRESTKASSNGSNSLATDIINGIKSVDIEKLRAPEDQWWSDLPSLSEFSFLSDKSDQKSNERSSTTRKDDKIISSQHDYDLDKDGASTASEEDEFQVKESLPRRKAQDKKPEVTPPQTKAKTKTQPPTKDPDATASDSDSDLDLESKIIATTQKKRTPTPENKHEEPLKKFTKAKGGLGVIGGKKKKEEKQPSPSPAPVPSPSPPPQAEPPAPETSKSAKEASTEAPATPKAKRSTKLGMIGGKSKKKAPVAPDPSSPVAEQEQEQVQGPPSARKGDTKETEATRPVKEEASQGSPKREEAAPPPAAAETEEQKTTRKRDELKRQLEDKSKAPKKKRRF
ncbi:hypothetical protein N7478_003409 [Penicillium angulare]|uniref:uncharacterized protein n=1 Tax=Penicillium angulare TaxID=116970 RepID=UPI002541ECB4|nr:uncharacterized protein N7478_003409 [Penicillium angulare]KAJ5287723.1 hypothetical protein N7478_003409 [Penicillium angulare]